MHEANNEFRDVLVVDDDPAMVRILSRIIEREGYLPVPSTDGAEALSILKSRQFHFLLTDLDMPKIDGVELCRQLRKIELPRYVYTLVLTGSKTDHLCECLVAGADDFIEKPIDPNELIARMFAGARVLQLESQLRFLVSYDPLTQILNRRTFFEQFELHWQQRVDANAHWACVMSDIDHFKRINDTYGHIAGDGVLRGVAEVLKSVFAETGVIGRYGGEEFCIVVNGHDETETLELTNLARRRIEESTFQHNGHTIPVTASFGVAHRRRSEVSPGELLALADVALIQAKRNGRNQVLCATVGATLDLLPIPTDIQIASTLTNHVTPSALIE
jgi:diguanylate cyclase (GGDEF)-like protein